MSSAHLGQTKPVLFVRVYTLCPCTMSGWAGAGGSGAAG